MCLLAVAHRLHDAFPLIIAANRDEMLTRAALPLGVLQTDGPRILAGQDELAGGTWLAVNEHGVVAGLTNKPTPGAQRDPNLRSRGELPLMLAQARTAEAAVDELVRTVRCEDYSPCWMFVGDRETLYYLDVTGTGAPRGERLDPGIHVLENRPFHVRSPKVEWIEQQMGFVALASDRDLPEQLAAILRSHQIPPGVEAQGLEAVDGFVRPAQTEAACVHAGPYGTRSASIVCVPEEGWPSVYAADGPLCTHDLEDRTRLWTS